MKTQLHDAIGALKATSGVSADEGERLAELASQVPDHGVIVEIGSCQGRSAAYMAAALRPKSKVLIYCVDLWMLGVGRTPDRHHSPGGYLRFKGNLFSLRLFKHIVPIMCESTKLAKVWTQEIDLLFIDGGHQYEEVKADYESWGKFVKPGGVIAFHDYTTWPSIKKIVDKKLNLKKDWEFLSLDNRIWSARKRGG
jgi:predicted O-methyltransferase YrrM